MAGCSGTPLAKKLGITEGTDVLTRRAPAHLPALLEPLPPGVRLRTRGAASLALAFFTRRPEVAREWPGLTTTVGPTGTVWVAWPKKAIGVATDLSEDVFRTLLLPTGWVDVKVCAVDETWSGLKWVLRKELR